MLTICFAIALYILRKADVDVDYLSYLIFMTLIFDLFVFGMASTLIQFIFTYKP